MAIRADDLQHFSVKEYLRLHDAEPELLEPTELLNGVIVAVSPESFLHAQTVRHIDELLNQLYPGRSWRNGSVRLNDSSLWGPDVYVLYEDADPPTQYPSARELELVVEVCVTTERQDLGEKLDVYAAEGIPTYWVIQPSGWAIVHRQPVRGSYHSIERIDITDYRDLTAETFRLT